jgi:uncharacterized protein
MSLLEAGHYHRFEAAGRPYVYLVNSAAVFGIDETADAVLGALRGHARSREDLVDDLSSTYERAELEDTITELARVRAIDQVAPVAAKPVKPTRVFPLKPFPVSTTVINVTNQCNLNCTYCYEYGDDKIVDTKAGGKTKFMTEETAREAIEFAFREAGDNPIAHVTFFGGETLLNFKVLEKTVAYARQRSRELGKDIDFSLTTNATLLKPAIIECLAENQFGVTVSIDGPKDMQNKFRVFHNGQGSYDVIAPNIKALIARHRTRPIGARVTLTSGVLDVTRIYRHLTEELGFHEVGFAPVTSKDARSWAIDGDGMNTVLAAFISLAREWLEAAVQNRHHGFSNVRETLQEIHQGMSKAYPCGAGLGLVGVSTDGDVALCHRFAGSEEHKLGTVRDGIDRAVQRRFLETHHIDDKPDCQSCFARPLCSGGCYHEAHTRWGDTSHANLHFCGWVRGWTDACLRIYGELAERNPAFLAQFDNQDAAERVS